LLGSVLLKLSSAREKKDLGGGKIFWNNGRGGGEIGHPGQFLIIQLQTHTVRKPIKNVIGWARAKSEFKALFQEWKKRHAQIHPH